ncbi:tetraacyldisaccharide 4'-kinase [Ichthyenterobacterium magnum]|uniref:Tetraacyldisaccharide 4'-kinase n=1 Tax=Ichthyenterobacterium magnum TaxID=1230530 RepID=A0A420DVM9_9FLAO|nr:tetraacyldisaccharide 4'-kinase [Ichthyenterobacterium magnum]RKE98279.1 lipid-A-disaccharide kinase [Ichthyenterobacterium magnum]
MKFLRYILFPVVPIYYLVTWLRNKAYDLGVKPSSKFDLPIICVGNLSVGGTGKTPMIEYLIRALKPEYKIATLSRGYKRKSEGFVIADVNASASTVGDEPFQFYKKFDDVLVSVDANRQNGIQQLLALKDKTQVILLDDAYQHRKVKAGFNILLTAYDNLYVNDIVLPTGNLREPRSGAKRADVIIVTKCPEQLDANKKEAIKKALKLASHQRLFFSYISYSEKVFGAKKAIDLKSLKDKSFTLVTGIANPKPLVEYLKLNGLSFEHLSFKDHHNFSQHEIENLKQKELVITTEKDYMRLKPHFKVSEKLFYLPIETAIDDSTALIKLVKKFVHNF